MGNKINAIQGQDMGFCFQKTHFLNQLTFDVDLFEKGPLKLCSGTFAL